ncbi:MAG: SDR family NAD(P)-dependent oxidoreductase [Lachnospiraceae bacterium]
MSFGLEDKVIVITGASRGLGRALAIGFAKEGAKVVINYCKNKKCAEKLMQVIQAYNDKCMKVYADVTVDADIKKMYQQVIKKYGKIDVLINNAGTNNDDYTNLMSEMQWNDVIKTNLTSVFLCCRYFTKSMIRMKSGRIINVASLKGQLGSEGQANYAASKAGIIGYSKSLAKELGKEGISVNVVCPGYIKTDLNSTNLNKKRIAEEMSAMSIEHGLEDFVNFILFLSSENLRGVSGQVFNIDSRIM